LKELQMQDASARLPPTSWSKSPGASRRRSWKTAELARAREPKVDFTSLSQVIYSAHDGSDERHRSATHAFLEAAKKIGAKVLYPCELQGRKPQGRGA
jgi:hypothetical protein